MILLIDNYDSFTYNLYQIIAEYNTDIKVKRNNRTSIEEIQAMPLKGIVLSPGPGRPEDAGLCVEIVQKLGPYIPILGVCLGHQAIGIAFKGSVKQAQKILHGKDSLIFHYRSHLFAGMPLPFRAGRYHSLIVEEEGFPPELKIEAEDTEGYIMALSHQTYPIFGVQFHPESIMTGDGQKIVKNFIKYCDGFVKP